MRQKPGTQKPPAEKIMKDIRRRTRKQHSAEEKIRIGLEGLRGETDTLMIDDTHLKTHRTASSLALKRGGGRLIGRTKGGLNSRLHAVTDALGRPIRTFPSGGQTSDYIGARAMLGGLP